MAAQRPDVGYSILDLYNLKLHDPGAAGCCPETGAGAYRHGRACAAHAYPVANSRDERRDGLHAHGAARRQDRADDASPRQRTAATGRNLPGHGRHGRHRHRARRVACRARRRNGRPERPAGRRMRRPRKAIDTLRARGFRIEVEIADVTDTAALDAMLERMDGTLPPLAGVIHSVGVLADAALGNQSWEGFETVAVAEDARCLAPAPGNGGSRPGYVRPVLERRRRLRQSGTGQPRGGQCLPRSARRPPARAGSSRTGYCLGCLVGSRRGRGAAGADRRPAGGIRHRLVLAGAGLQGPGAPAAPGCDGRCDGGRGLAGIRRFARRPPFPAGGPAREATKKKTIRPHPKTCLSSSPRRLPRDGRICWCPSCSGNSRPC